ncbi:F0F1 ATP synthase subunit A [Candidatus Peregrinibacteria bacterium]|nr:F0F1 ATP synthase subunit A [Candidatus Peregrinibacteria bacterium]
MAFTPPTLASETIAHIGSFPIRNSMVMGWLAMLVLITVALVIKKRGLKMVPRGLQNFVEMIVEGMFDFFDTVVQDKKQTMKFFPIVATIFIFVITSNWMGILPGVGSIGFYEKEHEIAAVENNIGIASTEENTETTGAAEAGNAEVPKEVFIPYFRSAYADVNMTFALAIISVVLTQIYGLMALGFFHYSGKFFKNPLKDPIGSAVGILELISEVSKMISFSFRLFGNIFAGEILLTVIGFLAPYIAPIPFYGLEIFVGFVQALVFSLLTLVFMKMAVTPHHEQAEPLYL